LGSVLPFAGGADAAGAALPGSGTVCMPSGAAAGALAAVTGVGVGIGASVFGTGWASPGLSPFWHPLSEKTATAASINGYFIVVSLRKTGFFLKRRKPREGIHRRQPLCALLYANTPFEGRGGAAGNVRYFNISFMYGVAQTTPRRAGILAPEVEDVCSSGAEVADVTCNPDY
jgi:hypothetical protein